MHSLFFKDRAPQALASSHCSLIFKSQSEHLCQEHCAGGISRVFPASRGSPWVRVTRPVGPGGAMRLFLCTENITCIPDRSFLVSLDCRGPRSSPGPRSQRRRHQRHRRRSCPPRSRQRFHSIRSEWWTARAVCVVLGSCGSRGCVWKGVVSWGPWGQRASGAAPSRPSAPYSCPRHQL